MAFETHTRNEKNFKSYRLFLLFNILDGIHKGYTRREICKTINKENSTLQHHLDRITKQRLIEQIQKQPYAIYKLTPEGDSMRKSIAHADSTIIYKCHNLIHGFRISDFGTWKFNEKLKKTMKGNWHFQKLVIDKHKIFIQDRDRTGDKGLIKIYCIPEFSDDPDATFGRMQGKHQRIANYLAEKYSMKLRPCHTVREGEKAAVGSEKLAKLVGHINQEDIGGVFTNASDGTLEIEEKQSSYKFNDLMKLPGQMQELLDFEVERIKVDKERMETDRELARDIREHTAVERKQNIGMDNLNGAINELRNVLKEIREELKRK